MLPSDEAKRVARAESFAAGFHTGQGSVIRCMILLTRHCTESIHPSTLTSTKIHQTLLNITVCCDRNRRPLWSKASKPYKMYFSCTTLLALLQSGLRFLSQPTVRLQSHHQITKSRTPAHAPEHSYAYFEDIQPGKTATSSQEEACVRAKQARHLTDSAASRTKFIS